MQVPQLRITDSDSLIEAGNAARGGGSSPFDRGVLRGAVLKITPANRTPRHWAPQVAAISSPQLQPATARKQLRKAAEGGEGGGGGEECRETLMRFLHCGGFCVL